LLRSRSCGFRAPQFPCLNWRRFNETPLARLIPDVLRLERLLSLAPGFSPVKWRLTTG
jgi:hypothetical protein